MDVYSCQKQINVGRPRASRTKPRLHQNAKTAVPSTVKLHVPINKPPSHQKVRVNKGVTFWTYKTAQLPLVVPWLYRVWPAVVSTGSREEVVARGRCCTPDCKHSARTSQLKPPAVPIIVEMLLEWFLQDLKFGPFHRNNITSASTRQLTA